MSLRYLRVRVLCFVSLSTPSIAAVHASSVTSVGTLHRFLSTADTDTVSFVSSSAPLVGVDYLISRYGLTRAQALKAAKKTSHLSSRCKPDAVLAVLGGTLGVPAAGIAAIVAMYPSILCTDVERTLAPRISDLSGIGLSRDEIARLVLLAPSAFFNRSICRNFEFWLKNLGSFDKLLRALRTHSGLLGADLDKVAKPNLALLRQCGLNASDIVAINIYGARVFTLNPNLLREAVERVEELGFERGTRMFHRALVLISLLGKEVVARRTQLLRDVGFSQDDVLRLVRKAPAILGLTHNKVHGNMNFLVKDVGLDFPYIARRPALIMYSLERRLLPRYWLLKVLKEKALLKGEPDYYAMASLSEKSFLKRFVLLYKDAVPGLAEGYALRCSGKARDRLHLRKE